MTHDMKLVVNDRRVRNISPRGVRKRFPHVHNRNFLSSDGMGALKDIADKFIDFLKELGILDFSPTNEVYDSVNGLICAVNSVAQGRMDKIHSIQSWDHNCRQS